MSGVIWLTLWSALNAEKLFVARHCHVRSRVALYISRNKRLASSEVLERVAYQIRRMVKTHTSSYAFHRAMITTVNPYFLIKSNFKFKQTKQTSYERLKLHLALNFWFFRFYLDIDLHLYKCIFKKINNNIFYIYPDKIKII